MNLWQSVKISKQKSDQYYLTNPGWLAASASRKSPVSWPEIKAVKSQWSNSDSRNIFRHKLYLYMYENFICDAALTHCVHVFMGTLCKHSVLNYLRRVTWGLCACVLPTQNMTWLTAAWPQTAEMSDVRARLELVSPSHSIFPVPKKKKKKMLPIKEISRLHTFCKTLHRSKPLCNASWQPRMGLQILTPLPRQRDSVDFNYDNRPPTVGTGERTSSLLLWFMVHFSKPRPPPDKFNIACRVQTAYKKADCRLQQSKLEWAFTRVKAEPYRPGMDRCWCARRCKWRALWLLHPRPRKIDSVALRKDTLMKTQSHACEERRARCIFGPKFIFWQGDGDGSLAHGQVAGRDMS